MLVRAILLFFLFSVPAVSVLAADIDSGEWRSVDDASNVSYVVGFTLGDVVGRSGQIRVAGRVNGGWVDISAAAPVASFDSGDSRRDRDMRDTVDADAYPVVRFSGEGQLCVFENDRCTMEVAGVLDFAGVERHYESIPVVVNRIDDDLVRANLSFEFLLSDHDVDRPRLLFWRIDDEVMISGTVTMSAVDPASSPHQNEQDGAAPRR